MNKNWSPRTRFRALINQPEPQLDLAEAALYIAWEDQGRGNPLFALEQIGAMAEQVRPHLANTQQPHSRIAVLNSYLFQELNFHGNLQNYDDPANSFLDQVIARRTGLPITLSVIYMEVSWRLGLPVSGVALPGHFLTRYATPHEEIFIDPFNQGRIWSREECEQQIYRAYGNPRPQLIRTIMTPPSRRAILVRMLRNLKHTYLASGNLTQALAAIERITLLTPDDAQEVRDRALLRSRLGQIHRALDDLELYATLDPIARDLPEIQKLAQALAEQLAYGN